MISELFIYALTRNLLIDVHSSSRARRRRLVAAFETLNCSIPTRAMEERAIVLIFMVKVFCTKREERNKHRERERERETETEISVLVSIVDGNKQG